MKKLTSKALAMLLLLTLTLGAVGARAERLQGEITIGGVPFVIDAHLEKGRADAAPRYATIVKRWGMEPKKQFDLGLFLSDPEHVRNLDCGFYGERMYVVGSGHSSLEYDEVLRFDNEKIEFHTNFGFRVQDCRYFFAFDRNTDCAFQRLYHNLPRWHSPEPGQVSDLPKRTYADALASLKPYFNALELEVGEPFYVEAWAGANLLDQLYMQQGGAFEDVELLPAVLEAWQDAPAFYSLYLPVYVEGLRCLTLGTGSEKRYANAYVAHAVVSENGLEKLAMGPFFSKLEPLGEAQPLLTADQALACARDADSFWYDDEQYRWQTEDGTNDGGMIVEIALEYASFPKKPIPENYGSSTLIPVWGFYVKTEYGWEGSEGSKQFSAHTTMFAIDAVTGERVL